MRTAIIFLYIFIALRIGYAQQEPQFTIFWNYYSLQNPAASGLFVKNFVSLCARHQWVGFPESPRTIVALYDIEIPKIHGGIGVNYLYGQLGYETNHKMNLNYSYHIRYLENRKLGIGVSFNTIRKTVDFSEFNTPDPILPDSAVTEIFFDINLGLMYKTKDFLIGLGQTQVLQTAAPELNLKNKRHFFFTSSYILPLNTVFELKPGIFLKSDFVSTQFDFNLTAYYQNRLWTGLTYRVNDAVCILLGIDLQEKFRIAYSYDITLSKLAGLSIGSHEVVFSLMLKEKS